MGRVNFDNMADVFRYHGPSQDQVSKYAAINEAAAAFAKVIMENAPDCADQTSAIRKVREARMDANSAIALNGLI